MRLGIIPSIAEAFANASRPGGNVTGLSVQATETTGKRIEQLREVVPDLRRLAIIFDAGYPATVAEMGNVQATAALRAGLPAVGFTRKRGHPPRVSCQLQYPTEANHTVFSASLQLDLGKRRYRRVGR